VELTFPRQAAAAHEVADSAIGLHADSRGSKYSVGMDAVDSADMVRVMAYYVLVRQSRDLADFLAHLHPPTATYFHRLVLRVRAQRL